MHYADILISRLVQDPKLSNIVFRENSGEHILPFPLRDCCVFYRTEHQQADFLIGDPDPLFSDSLYLTVAVHEKLGSSGCRRTAENICIELTRLDSEKNILALSGEPCRFNEDMLAYLIEIRLRLRADRRSEADDDPS